MSGCLSNQGVASQRTDFRRISWGDIDLRVTIRADPGSRIVHGQNHQGRVRRMYSGRIESRKSEVAIAVYQGDNAEEADRHSHSINTLF
jgi:hypothetical protein